MEKKNQKNCCRDTMNISLKNFHRNYKKKKDTCRLNVPIGTIRIKASTLQAYEKTAASWKKSNKTFAHLLKAVKLFKANKNFKVLIDTKSPSFLKGQLSPEGRPQGARINVLPDGTVLDKAYSLFAKHLTFHDQSSHDHWDVIYQNKGGTYAYSYTLNKKRQHQNNKYKKVWEFDKRYSLLTRNVNLALRNEKDPLAVPMYTLLKTYMRVGNEIYYRTHKHKGLTTLKKKDIAVSGNKVTFNYIAKDGVPRIITLPFPDTYIFRLKKLLQHLKQDDFVFTSNQKGNSGHPLREEHFKKAFKNYCGQEFYPHIVRSHFATTKVKEFLKGKRKIRKEEVEKLFLSIAAELGHKKFVKKEHVWKDNYTVTVNHYVQPELIEKIKEITVK